MRWTAGIILFAAMTGFAAAQTDTSSGPSELDILSRGSQSDFPDLEEVKKRKPVAVTLRALNKVTAKYADIVINMNEKASFGALEITPRYCDKRPPEEFPETTAFIEILDNGRKPQPDLKQAADAAPEPAAPSAVPIEIAAAASPHAPPPLPENMIFSGWMFASSPALNGVEHPVYDVWVIDCKTADVEG
jgi:hypothetical protein